MHLIVILMMFVSLSYAKIEPKSIVAVWLFDEGKGNTASDSSGNGHDGEIGSGIKWIAGQYGSKALHFPGNAVVIVPHEASLNLLTWTITAWIKAEFKNGWVEFVSKSVPAGNTDFRNYVLQIENNTGLLRPHFTHGAQQWKLTAGTTDLRDGKWHHVAGTYDQNFIRAYVDGRMEGEAAFKDVPDTNEEPLVIGAITPKVNFFTGVIDEVGLFNIGLTEDDLKMIQEVGLSRALAVSLSEKLATTWSAIKTEH
jgi:hypothetical protein